LPFNYNKEWSSWKWDIPEFYNIGADVVDRHAESEKGDNVALYWRNADGEEKNYTFLDLKYLTNKFGNALKEIGLGKNDRFLIRLPNIPEFQISFIGGVKIGAIPIPSSVMFRAPEIEYRINDSKAVAVVTSPQYIKEVEAVVKNCPTLDNIFVVGDTEKYLSYWGLMNSMSPHLKLAKTRSDDIAFFCYTSGTTGPPKGAVHLHRWVLGNDPSAKYWQALRENDIVAHTGDLSWIFPLGNGFLYVWRWGVSTLIYNGRFQPEAWFELIEKYRVTNLASVPTCYRLFLTVKDAENRYDLSSLRHCISAGEPLNPEVVQEWKRRIGLEIYDGIGMTEVMVYLSNFDGLPIKSGSCGKPQPGHECAIVDENGTPLPPEEDGILAIKIDDPGLFQEYWNKPQETAICHKNEWFLTGDVLYKDDDGYYWFSGRSDDLIMASGYRISPFEVESAVISHPSVLEAAVVASPDSMRGVNVKAFIILNQGYEPSDNLAKDIQKHTKRVAAPYKYPREIEFVESLPKTQSGKIKRKELREQESRKKGS